MRRRALPTARSLGLVVLALLLGCVESERGVARASPGIETWLHLESEDGHAAERFDAGEPVALVLTLRNPGDQPWRLPLSSAQSHDFAIVADGRELWRWSDDRRFAQRLGELALAPGEERRFRATWRPDRVGAVPPPGRYRAAGWVGGGGQRGPGAELEFRVAARQDAPSGDGEATGMP